MNLALVKVMLMLVPPAGGGRAVPSHCEGDEAVVSLDVPLEDL